MSFVTAQPELLFTAAGELQGIGTAVQAQTAATAGATTAVAPPAGDVVSALMSVRFSAYGAQFQTVAAQAAAVNQMFAAALSGGASSYAAAEAANVVAAG